MSEHFISRSQAEKDLLSCATYLAERIRSIDGRAEGMLAVIPQHLSNGNVDLAAELANTIDDPYTRDRLLIAVAEKCAAIDDDEYSMQLADAVEDQGLRSQAFERIGLQKASKGQFEKANEIAGVMDHPDGVLIGMAIKQAADGLESEALKTVGDIEHAGAAVTALVEIGSNYLRAENAEKAAEFFERAFEEAADIEHTEERARAYCDIGMGFTDAGRNDRAIVTFDKAKATAETIDNMHRDAFLSMSAQGFLHAGSLDLADRTLDLVADKTHIASCLLGYSREFWKKGDQGEAIDSLEEAYAMLESQHERETRDHKTKFRLFTSIAAQFAGFEKGERAIEIAERIPDDEQRTAALVQIATILTTRKEDEQARQAFRSIADDGDRVFALIAMSDAKETNGDRAAAAEILQEAVELVETVPQLTMRVSAYSEIGNRMKKFGEAAVSKKLYNDALEAITELRDDSARVAAIASLSETGADVGEATGEVLRSLLVKQAAM